MATAYKTENRSLTDFSETLIRGTVCGKSARTGLWGSGKVTTHSTRRQQKDNEIYGEGSALSFKYRIEDVRLGRFISIDPLSAKYPFNSSYAFSENRTIDMIELEGLEVASPPTPGPIPSTPVKWYVATPDPNDPSISYQQEFYANVPANVVQGAQTNNEKNNGRGVIVPTSLTQKRTYGRFRPVSGVTPPTITSTTTTTNQTFNYNGTDQNTQNQISNPTSRTLNIPNANSVIASTFQYNDMGTVPNLFQVNNLTTGTNASFGSSTNAIGPSTISPVLGVNPGNAIQINQAPGLNPNGNQDGWRYSFSVTLQTVTTTDETTLGGRRPIFSSPGVPVSPIVPRTIFVTPPPTNLPATTILTFGQ